MFSSSPPPAQSSLLTWGLGLAATSLILIGGGALVWSTKSAPPADPPPDGFVEQTHVLTKRLPPLPPDDIASGLHTISYAMENGVRVIKIRVVAEGDELIVDAATGRLLESRPNGPTAPPMGKFTAPFQPMM
jgi:hypothetical protein